MQLADLTHYPSSANTLQAGSPTGKTSVRGQFPNQDKIFQNIFSPANLSNFITQRTNASRPLFFTSAISPLNTILGPTNQLTSIFTPSDQGSRLRSLLQNTISLQQLYSPELTTELIRFKSQLQQTQLINTVITNTNPADLELIQDKSSEHHSNTISSTISPTTVPTAIPQPQTTEKQYLQQESQSNTTRNSKHQPSNERATYQPYEKSFKSKQDKKPQQQASRNFLQRLIRWSLNLFRGLSLGR